MPEMTSYEPGTPCWIDVASPDPEANSSFYEGLFGWQTSEAGDPEETGGYRMFSQGDKTVAGIMATQDDSQPPTWTTYVAVEDADATAEAVKAAGGSILFEPMDVMTAGRMAVVSDPAGAVFAIWQAVEFPGSELVNEPVTLCWNELRTRDPEEARKFYSQVFGWGAGDFPAMEGYVIWFVGAFEPGSGKGGMVDLTNLPVPDDVPPHWDVAFAVEDADSVASKCAELGGTVNMAPFDSPVGRMAALQDPAGAPFTVIKLNPPEDMPQ